MQVTVSWLKDCFEAGVAVQLREHHLPEGPSRLQKDDAHATNDALPITRDAAQSRAVQGDKRAPLPTPLDESGLCSDDVHHAMWLERTALSTSQEGTHQLHRDGGACFHGPLPSSLRDGACTFAVAHNAIRTITGSVAAVESSSFFASHIAICNAAAVPESARAIDRPVIRNVTPPSLPQPLPRRGTAAAIDAEPSGGGYSRASGLAVGAPAQLSQMIRSSTVANAESV